MKLRCPVCRDTFGWDPKLKWPDSCPLPDCGAHIGTDRADDDIVMPFIRTSAKTKATDKVYRDIEAASENRVHQAAELAGCDASDMASLKITDLKSTQPGEVSAPLVSNPVSQFMDANPNAGGFRGGAGLEYSAAVQTGAHANSGARTRTMLQAHHASISHGVAVSDRPALETIQPGYRRRG